MNIIFESLWLIMEDKFEDEKFNLELNHETKHQGDNDLWYVATLLVCRKYSISDLVSFVD